MLNNTKEYSFKVRYKDEKIPYTLVTLKILSLDLVGDPKYALLFSKHSYKIKEHKHIFKFY